MKPLTLAIVALSVLMPAASGQINSAPPGAHGLAGVSKPVSPDETRVERDRVRKLNSARQAEIKKETDKLLQLATELKHSVDKSSENTLSLDVVKKAEEIEKLAKQVKEKMRTGY